MSRFIAAMDHSGGSSPGVLERYGYPNAHELPHEVVMDDIHLMRLRMANSPDFNSNNIWAAILYQDTVKRDMVPFLKQKHIEAFLKVDSGCEEDGTLKQFPLDEMIEFARERGCYGTKMRSIVKTPEILDAVLDQQFDLAEKIYAKNLIPIVEPEIPIEHEHKQGLEIALFRGLEEQLDKFNGKCILKLTLPEQSDMYIELTKHKNVNKIVGLSGGYPTMEACRRLSANTDVTASFSRALSEGLNIRQTDAEFNAKIKQNINMIVQASKA